VIERYRYDAAACPERSRRGACTVLDADGSADADGISDVLNPYTFTGRRLDLESGLMQYRNRYYHIGLGRFISWDPEGYAHLPPSTTFESISDPPPYPFSLARLEVACGGALLP